MSFSLQRGDLVAVTGATGYIATHTIERLFQKGFGVRACVRDSSNKQKFAHLEELAKQHNAHLEIVQAELQADQYIHAFKGVKAVIHTATPYIYTAPDPQKDIVDPAIEGTLSALRAAKSAGVGRVVITSSGGAVFHFPVPAGYKFTADDWNTQSSLTNNPYFYSKKLAEEAAWNWSKENPEVQVVVVNPVFVQGPLPSSNINTSVSTLKSYLLGTGKVAMPDGYIAIVDVRDVADAHAIAVEHPDAVGKRLFCSNTVVSWKHLADTVAKLYTQYPNLKVESSVSPQGNWTMDTSPLAALGKTEYIPFETMVRDTVESLIKFGLVEKL
eukprot:TRINITY_DN4431_c0_g2_i1.p1 TRINITY_DN4431_c0_g2~~TRINITY_DN4431_c0_g2_i1.p1  ORF type:complete len:328 (+),score=83.26 TRINITY_DN4431_c0_g2_i1:99-1082(+)